MAAPPQLTHAPSGSLAYTFVDEEVLLGFKIWVAELELLVGNARGRTKPDQVQCFQLLQKLAVTLDRSSRPEVKEYQRRCEEAVVDILLKGAPPPVRRLICQVLAKLYLLGDQLPLYSRVSSLQLFLGTREAFSKDMCEDIRLGALECMAALYYSQGRFLSIGVQETVAVAAKYCNARHLGERTLQAALMLLAAAVEGVGGGHRHTQATQQDVFRAVERLLGTRDASQETKLACAGVLRALGACGGAFLWASSLAGFEAVKSLCLAGLEDPSPAVRSAFAQALGQVAVASTSEAAQDSLRGLEKWPKYAAVQRKALDEVPTACLTAPFVEAASSSNRSSCTALAQAWVSYLVAIRGSLEEQSFVELAGRVLEMLGAACMAAGSYQEASIVAGEGELGMGIGSGERPHAQACVLYVLRVGVIEQLGEGGQRLLLDKLAAVLGAPLGQYTPVGVVTLEAMALLLEVLGEVSTEKRAELEPAVGTKVVGPHACLRLQAAGAVAALVVAEPSSAARLVSASLANLEDALEKLVAATASGPPDRSRPGVPGTPRGVGSAKLKPDMDAVHGWALTGAALLAASRRLPLGIPAALTAAVMRYATRLITAPQAQLQGAVSCLEREAGYILLGSLCATLPGQMLGAMAGGCAGEAAAGAEALLALFGPALGAEAATELDRRYCSNVTNLEHVVAMELWWRTAALQALAACIQGPLAAAAATGRHDSASCGALGGTALYKRVAALLKPTLEVLMAHSALQEPARGKGGPAGMFGGAAALLQLRLLEAYAALPSPVLYTGEQEALTKLCMRTVKAAATGTAGQMLHSALRRWLHGRDAMLGPWQQGRDPLERALYSFEGVVGGPAIQPWQAGSRRGIGYAMEDEDATAAAAAEGGAPTPSPYPQPLALGAALLEAQLSLVGCIMAAVAPINQAAILDALIGIVQGGPQKKKDKEPAKRQAAAMAAAAAALAGAAALASAGRGAALAAAQAELAPRMRQLADDVLEESGGSVALQRAAADLYAASALLSADAAAATLVRGLCKEMAETASLSRRAALSLAVGGVARAVGGLSLQGVLTMATETLVAVARATDQSISIWILHAMLLLANAAGLAFVPHLKLLLNLAEGSLLSEGAYSLPGLLPAVGRLANASVALLGPDYTFGSRPYLVCKSIINDMRALEGAGAGGGSGDETAGWGGTHSTDDAVSAALETVLYAQMLVLFAPQAVPAKSHLPVLVSNLLSRQPRLRKAAADTLRHLAERDAEAVLAERVEAALFAALDSETDPGIASQIKATLSTLLAAGAASEPSRWLTLCTEVVMAAAPGSMAAAEEEAAAAAEQAVHDSEDEEGAVARPAPAPPSAAPSSGAPGATKGLALSPRLRTRLFAAQLLLQIPGLVQGADCRHTDLGAAQAAVRAGVGGDWLVLRLQQLVDLAFRMASGQLEALRPHGVALMGAVLSCWGKAEDPVVEGARLLELYQAQIVSTLRASLAAGAAPLLAAEGAALAASFLDKGLDGGDTAVLQRMMALLVAPLAQWSDDRQDELYAEWVGVQARVALLEAHAHCTVLAAAAAVGEGGSKARVVHQAQSPHLQLLLDSWMGLLQDYVAVCTQPAEVHAGYRLRLCQLAPTPPAADHTVLAVAAAEDCSARSKAASSEAAAAAVVLPASRAVTPGPTPAAVLDAVRPALQRAWSFALAAASSTVAEQQLAVGGSEADTAAAQQQHALLLDVCQMALGQAAEAALGAASATGGGDEEQRQQLAAAGLSVLATVLGALRCLTGLQFAAAGWLAGGVTAELAVVLRQLLQQVLLPLASAGWLAAPGQAASLAGVVAAVLRQLPAGSGVQPEVIAAAKACLQLAASGNSEGDSSASVAAALAAVGQQLHAAATPEAFIPCLHQALELGVEVACSGKQQEQLAAAAAFLADAAAAAATREHQQPGSGGSSSGSSKELPEVETVLAAAVQALAQHAKQVGALTNGAANTEGLQLEAMLAGLLALGGAMGPVTLGGSGVIPAPVAAAAVAPAAPTAAAALPLASGGFADEENLGDDPFAEAEPASPAADPAAAERVAAPDATAADAGKAVGSQGEVPAAADDDEGDDWGDDPFGDSSVEAEAETQPEKAPAAVAPMPPALEAPDAEAAEAETQGPAGGVEQAEEGECGAAAAADDAPELTAAEAVASGSDETADEEEDDWGDDLFVSSSSAAAEAHPAVASASGAEQAAVLPAAEDATPALAGLFKEANGSPDAGLPVVVAARRLILDLLAELAGSSSATLQLHTLIALRAFFQQQAAAVAAGGSEPSWALQCAAAAIPGALGWVHELMSGSGGGGGRLGEPDIQLVAEALKVGLLAANLAGSSTASNPVNGESAQASLLHVLVPVLVEVVAPEAPPTPLLVDMAVKLLTHLAVSPAAPAFRTVAAQLPATCKQRLQVALKQVTAGTAAAQQQAVAATTQQQAASTGPMQRASVKLNFAAFKK